MEEGEPAIDLEVEVSPSPDVIRIDVTLTYEDAHASYVVVVSGQWSSEDQGDFEAAIISEDPALEELIKTVLAPQIVPVAQARILELSRGIDCPFTSFPYAVNRQMYS